MLRAALPWLLLIGVGLLIVHAIWFVMWIATEPQACECLHGTG